jgi:hypothetical protein
MTQPMVETKGKMPPRSEDFFVSAVRTFCVSVDTRPFLLGKRLHRSWRITTGDSPMAMARRVCIESRPPLLGCFPRTPGVCRTCTETCGNGAWMTGTEAMREPPWMGPPGWMGRRRRARGEERRGSCCAAALGAASPGTALGLPLPPPARQCLLRLRVSCGVPPPGPFP